MLRSHLLVWVATISALSLTLSACGEQQPAFVAEESSVHRTTQADGATTRDGGDAMAAPGAGAPNGEDSTAGDLEHREGPQGVGANGPRDGTNATDIANGQSSEGHADSSHATSSTGTDTADTRNDDEANPGSEGTPVVPDNRPPGTEGPFKLPKQVVREMTFAAQLIGNGSVSKDLDNAYLTSQITMTRNYPSRVKQVSQSTRAVAVDNFEQGNSGATETQLFDQVANRPLDIVVVIDDSGSMAEEQQNMATKLAPLMSYIQDSDWQIGVVTTDPSEGCLRSLIKKSDTNPSQLFADAVTAGITHSGNERGNLQAVRALAGTCRPQPWVRADSTIAVLIVSDEDNCSANGGDCPGKDYATADYLYDYLASIREPGKNARVYGLIWHPTQTKAQCSTGANKGTVYADVIARTSGTWGSICAADYSETLSAMSNDIRVVLNSKFTLTYVPEPASVQVLVDSTPRSTGVTITGKVVELNPPPPVGAKVTINYRHDATPVKTNFALRFKPDASRLGVVVNGQAVDPSAYSVNVSTTSINFETAPSQYAKIVVSYTRNDSPLSRTFALGETIKPGTMSVKVNNASVSNFTSGGDSVTFTSAPPDGATIQFFYTQVGDPVLRYPFSPAYATPLNLEAFDANNGNAVAFSHTAGNVDFPVSAFVEGRKVNLRYDNVSRQAFEVALPADPLPGVSAVGGQITCTSAPRLSVVGRMVSVAGCGFDDNVNSVTVKYTYVLENRTSFQFTGDNLPKATEFQAWAVWVNGVSTTDFIRQGATISFDHVLPQGATVKVQLTQEEI